MPFQSKAQRRFMHAKHPGIAKEFEAETKGKELPEKKESAAVKKAELVKQILAARKK